MKTKLEKSLAALKNGNGEALSEFDEILEHIKKNINCEFIRVIEKYSQMSFTNRKKFIEYAERL